jgi:hypothetical protein
MPSVPDPLRRAKAQRTTGMAMMGSAVALAVVAALTWVGVVPMGEGIREWATAGIAVAAVFEGAIGLYFLRASSQP